MLNDDERLSRLRKKANSLPLSPGVYLMKNKSGKIIYVGKAVRLKNRVSQYFRSNKNHNDKVRKMVSNVEDFEYIICDSEFEALILECSLIKQHDPKYNILLRDDKGYHYIKITKGEYPKIQAVMQLDNDDAEFLGPYNSAFVVRQTVDEALKVFKLPSCSKTVFGQKKGRPCLNYHIGACSAPCCGKISKEEYNKSVAAAVDFIKNGASSSVADLKQKMNEAAENLEFEKAAKLRDRINAIERIRDKQKVVFSSYKRQDIIAMAKSENKACFTVFVFRNGMLCDRREFLTELGDDLSEMRSEFIRRFYTLCPDVPERVVLDEAIGDAAVTEQWLSELANRRVHIVVPQIGEQKNLVLMCKNNAAERLSKQMGYKSSNAVALDELGNILGLENAPKYIESYDISNHAGDENVGAMVVFFNGEPLKSAYKLFKIKSFDGQDDCRSMAEVLDRRFSEYEKAKDKSSGFGRLPDLILLDGGKTQLSAVKEVMKKHNISVPVFGMVKDSRHKTNAITSGGETIAIKGNRRAFTLVYTIQEEVHRFAIGFHRKRMKNKNLTSELLAIEGVGKASAEKLLSHFKSINKIKNATKEELLSVKGISKKTAENIYNYFYIK